MLHSIISITHYLFLSEKQRYDLKNKESEIEVTGLCSYSLIDNNAIHLTKTPDEIFAKYKIIHCPNSEEHTVTFTENGFLIKLSPDIPLLLLNFKDGGISSLNLVHNNVIKAKDKTLPVVHFLNIEDLQMLENSMC